MSDGCVFCDRTKFEERIIGENKEFWFVATLGQITDGGYTLIIPKRHVSCIGAMTEQEVADIERAADRVSEAIRREYGIRPIMFEHGVVGQTIQHAHLHIVPAEIRLCNKIYRDFPCNQLYFLPSLEMLRWLWTHFEEKKYLFWSTPEGLLKAILNLPAPSQYLRIVTAELTHRPERANWRNVDPELDKRLWTETVKRLKPYF